MRDSAPESRVERAKKLFSVPFRKRPRGGV
jgi:hypothetical protein